MKKLQLKKLAKRINDGKEVNIKFVPAPPEYFCYQSNTDTLEISSYYHRLSKVTQIVYLTHEIGHMNTIANTDSLYVSDYTAEYEANRWAMYRLDEMNLPDISGAYQIYLKELACMEVKDDYDEEYQEAAADLLQELELI